MAIDQWSVGAEKTNEPTLLTRHVEKLLRTFPMLTLLTGGAIFMQRPLLRIRFFPSLGDFVMDVFGGEHGLGLMFPLDGPQSMFDPPLAIAESILYDGVHSKSFCFGGVRTVGYPIDSEKHRGFRVFYAFAGKITLG